MTKEDYSVSAPDPPKGHGAKGIGFSRTMPHVKRTFSLEKWSTPLIRLASVIIIFFLGLTMTGCLGKLCTESEARVVGQAYLLANPFEEGNLTEFLTQHREFFEPGGPGVRCAHALGEHLKQTGQSAYDPAAYLHATGVTPPEFSQEISESITSGHVDLVRMGEELIWLSTVLPAAARGDLGPFQTTGTTLRQQLRQGMLMMKTPDQWARYQHDMHPLRQNYGPLVIDQIIMLALMMPETNPAGTM